MHCIGLLMPTLAKSHIEESTAYIRNTRLDIQPAHCYDKQIDTCSDKYWCKAQITFFLKKFFSGQVMFACGKYNLVHDFFNKVTKSSIPNALTYKGNVVKLVVFSPLTA